MIDLYVTFSYRKLPIFASPFLDQRAKYVNAMPILWDGNGVHLPAFKMLPTVLNKIHSSHDLSVILVALHLMAVSWMPELLSLGVFPYQWKGIHFSNKKFECLEVMSREDITNPQIYMHGYSQWSVCQAHSQPRHLRSHQHQSEGLLDWLLWVPLEQIREVLSEKMPRHIWGRWQVLQQIPPVFVWSWPLCTVHYDISLDLHSICGPTLDMWSSYWPQFSSTAPRFSFGPPNRTKNDATMEPSSHSVSPVITSLFRWSSW